MAEARFADVPWIEPIVLLGASQRAERISDAARARMKPWVEAARARYRVARELRDPETQTVALSLLREATFFALCALTLAEAESPPRTFQAAWERCRALHEDAEERAAEHERLGALFTAEDPLVLDLVPSSEMNKLRLAAEATVVWLLSLAEVRSPRELARVRLARSILSVLAALAVVSALIAYALALGSLSAH